MFGIKSLDIKANLFKPGMPDTPYSQRLLKRTEFETFGLNQQMAPQDLSI